MASDAGVAHAFAGERKAAFVERHTVRLLLARFMRFFRLLDYLLVETRRHLLLRTLSHINSVLTDAFVGGNSTGAGLDLRPGPKLSLPFLQLRLELEMPDAEEPEAENPPTPSRQRQVTIAATPTESTSKSPSRLSRAIGSAERSPEPVLRLQPDAPEVFTRISQWLHSLETAIGASTDTLSNYCTIFTFFGLFTFCFWILLLVF